VKTVLKPEVFKPFTKIWILSDFCFHSNFCIRLVDYGQTGFGFISFNSCVWKLGI